MTQVRNAREIKSRTPEEVVEKLEELGVSKNAFAQMVGVGAPMMYLHLSGKRGASNVLRIRIAEILERLEDETRAPRMPEGMEIRVRRL